MREFISISVPQFSGIIINKYIRSFPNDFESEREVFLFVKYKHIRRWYHRLYSVQNLKVLYVHANNNSHFEMRNITFA